MRVGTRLGLLDHPDGDRRIHTCPVPRTGGLAVALAATVGLLIGLKLIGSSSFSVQAQGFAAAIALIVAVGIIDDWRGIPPIAKLVVQSAAAYLAVSCGLRIDHIAITPDVGFSTGVFAYPLTILWLVAITNAVNLVDGVDGLASSVGIVACSALAIADTYLGADGSAIGALAMTGALLGFMRYNRSPARVFLGDAGSMGLGFSLGLLSVSATTDATNRTYMLVPVFALAYPIIDTSIAIARRWLRGHPLSRADGRHVHHRLLALQFSAGRAVALLTIVFGCVAIAGLVVTFAPAQLTVALFIGTLLFFLIASLYAVRLLHYNEFVELGAAFVSVLFNARTVVREKILAGDLAEQITTADSFDRVQSMIVEASGDLKLVSMELIHREPHPRNVHPIPITASSPQFKLDYHVATGRNGRNSDLVLRIWSTRERRQTNGRPSAERIAARVGPAVEDWIKAHPDVLTALAEADSVDQRAVNHARTS
ncbi:MAG TPA: MraY family glycosyltransferase [Gemmatimonadaceae bacterium]|jgi:UDP-GlcNAc:undecaprenyl-phosphate GlcNAc-1-phosphate transferase